MRPSYGKLLASSPDLHCDLFNRTLLGNTVIDYEDVVILNDKPTIKAIVTYRVEKLQR